MAAAMGESMSQEPRWTGAWCSQPCCMLWNAVICTRCVLSPRSCPQQYVH